MIWIFVGLAAFTVLFMLGVRQFATNSAQHKLIVVGTLEGTTTADVPRTVSHPTPASQASSTASPPTTTPVTAAAGSPLTDVVGRCRRSRPGVGWGAASETPAALLGRRSDREGISSEGPSSDVPSAMGAQCHTTGAPGPE